MNIEFIPKIRGVKDRLSTFNKIVLIVKRGF